MTLDELLSRTLLLDIEATKSGRIHRIGAVFNDRVVEASSESSLKKTLSQIEDLAFSADFVLGHNLLGHDFPTLQAAYPRLAVLGKPVIDTLYLSPLAFPQNPYHRLVKDYKLVRSCVNDPVADARLAASVFRDQWESFWGSGAGLSHPIDLYRFCFEASLPVYRVREFAAFIRALSDHQAENRKASELLGVLDELGSKIRGSPW